MDQQRFESEVLRALGSEAPSSSADEPFEEAAASEAEHDEDNYGEDNALEDARVEETDTFEEGGEEAFIGEDDFEEEEEQEEPTNPYSEGELDALEESMADAIAGRNADEFFRTLLRGVGQIAGLTQRDATRVSQASHRAGTAHRGGEEVTEGAARVSTTPRREGSAAQDASHSPNPLGHFLRLLRQHQRQGFDEIDSLEELADEFAEGGVDEALPVLAGLAARAVLRPVAGRSANRVNGPLRRRLIHSAIQTARALVRRRGPEGIRALPRIIRRVARRAARQGLRPEALPQAIRRTAAQMLAQPGIASRPSQTAPAAASNRRRTLLDGFPQRLILQGPVEIQIFGRS
jgi:hypothetical protein